MTLAAAFGWAGTACIIVLNLPQVWRTCVHGLTAGVPASRAWVAIWVGLLWLGYGLYGGGLVQVVLNGTVIVLNLLLLTRLRTERLVLAGLGAGVLAAAVVVVGATAGRGPLGLAGAVVGSGLCLPQLLELRGAEDVRGVSAASLWLQGAGAVGWLGYGFLRAETVVVVPNVFVLATVVGTLVLLRAVAVREPALAQA